MLKLKMIDKIDGKPQYPPPKLTGSALWAYRAWLYLPIPTFFLNVLFDLSVRGSVVDIWFGKATFILLLSAYLFASVILERRNGLRMATAGETTHVVILLGLYCFAQFIGNSIDAGHFFYKYPRVLYDLPIIVLAVLPFSTSIYTEHKRKKAPNSEVSP
jgi:hypothetical protein